MRKDLNEVVLTGDFQPHVSDDGRHVGGRLSTAEHSQADSPDTKQCWHTLVAVTGAAKESIRHWNPAVPLACAKGRFRRREYLVEGQPRYVNEILLFDPVTVPASAVCRAEIRLEGHLGTRPDIRYTAKGLAVITLSVATNHSRRDRNTPAGWIKETVWHRALLFGDEARKKVETLTKGSFVSLSGELTYRPRRRSEDGAVAEILVKQLTLPGIAATQKGRAGAHSTGFDPHAAQPPLLTAANAPLTYAPGEHF